MLSRFNCQNSWKEKIARCVLEHSGPGLSRYSPTSLESEIVMNADAVAAFKKYQYLFFIHYSSHGKDSKKTKKWLKEKLERSWETKLTLPGIKEELSSLYEKIKNFLK
jgi:hypothetical protein